MQVVGSLMQVVTAETLTPTGSNQAVEISLSPLQATPEDAVPGRTTELVPAAAGPDARPSRTRSVQVAGLKATCCTISGPPPAGPGVGALCSHTPLTSLPGTVTTWNCCR